MEDLAALGHLAQRKAKTQLQTRTGRQRASAPTVAGETGFSVAVDATLKRAALRQGPKSSLENKSLKVTAADLCKKIRHRPCEHLVVFVLDASESMGGNWQQRMKAAKGAVLALLRTAYQGRHRVALVAFGGEEAKVVLPPTGSVNLAVERLKKLHTGGATPLADGLQKARQIIRTERCKHPGVQPILLVISDGEANVPLVSGVPPLRELARLAEEIRREQIRAVFVDVAAEPGRSSPMQPIARQMGAAYKSVREWQSRQLVRYVQEAE